MLTLAVFAFGAVNLIVVGRLSYRALSIEQSRRLSFIAGLMARRVEEPILHDDRVSLHALIGESVGLDPDVSYIVVTDAEGTTLAHTFGAQVPDWALAPELVGPHRDPLVLFRSDRGTLYRELAAPVLGGSLGVVRVGLEEAGVRSEVVTLLSILAAMVTAFLASGIAATVWVARRITSPLTEIVNTLESFELDGGPVSLDVRTADEMEVLARHVHSMTDRLQRMHRTDRERERELARVERLAALGTLTAGLAHELNNPLAGIKSAAQRLDSVRSDPDRTDRYARVIIDATQRMELILRGFLDFSRVQEVQLEEVSVPPCIEAAVELARSRLQGCAVDILVEPSLPPATADSNLLVHATLNLLLNAADAVTGSQEPRVSVEARHVDQQIHISVTDSGPGVPADIRERIFNPFFTTKPGGEGTGLGLSTSWMMIQEMGGSLALVHDWPSGARFAIELQAAEEDEHA
jgi:two-component system NtrC family sensor kinase